MGAVLKQDQQKAKQISVDDLRTTVLDAVSGEQFDHAITELEVYLNQPSEYPQFRQKMERLVSHAIDLVNAIRAKKKFPGMTSLTRSKQKELAERTSDHFNELNSTFGKIERTINQLKREDIRSTVWILRAIVYSGGLLALIGFLKEVTGGLWGVFETVMERLLDGTIDWILNLF